MAYVCPACASTIGEPNPLPISARELRFVPLKTRASKVAEMLLSQITILRLSGAVHDHHTVLSAKESPSGSFTSTLASTAEPFVTTVSPERAKRSAKLSLRGGRAGRIRKRKTSPEPAYPDTAR